MSKCGNCCYGVMTGPNRMFCSAQNCFCEEVFDCEDYEPIVKPTTNYDRLRAKSVEEMAEAFANACPEDKTVNRCCQYFAKGSRGCHDCWLDWLKQEADT